MSVNVEQYGQPVDVRKIVGGVARGHTHSGILTHEDDRAVTIEVKGEAHRFYPRAHYQVSHPKAAVLDDVPNATYHASPALSKSGLVQCLRSVDHYHAYKERCRGPVKALDNGRALHELVLMGEAAFDALVTTRPDDDRGNFRTKAGKEWRDEQLAAGRAILDAADYNHVRNAAAAVLGHPTAGPLLAECIHERSHYWYDEQHRVPCRCRPDSLTEDGAVIVDLKTTRDAGFSDFRRSVLQYRYDMQYAHYADGVEATLGVDVQAFVLIAVELEPPYGVALYHLESEWRDRGAEAVNQALSMYSEFRHFKDEAPPHRWGYPAEIQTMEVPTWAR